MDTFKLKPWLHRWNLIPDGTPFITHTSQLYPVKTAAQGIKAMLKVTDDLDEQAGNALMAWREGNGAAQVIAHEDDAGRSILRRRPGAPGKASNTSAGT